MPHHESGLLALRTTDPEVIDRAVQFFREKEPHHSVHLVRVDGGKGVLLTFSSCLSPETDRHVDLSAFQRRGELKKLAQLLKLPIWVGFAIGGFSNEQVATALSAKGEVLWTSSFNFGVPKNLRARFGDPFTDVELREQLTQEIRAGAGYGLIGAELGFDYFRVLSIDVGDPLFARHKRTLGKEGASEHAKWLKGRYSPPEGESQAPVSQAPVKQVYFRFLLGSGSKTLPSEDLAAVLVSLLRFRELPPDGLTLESTHNKKEQLCVISGPAMKTVGRTLTGERFIGLVAALVKGTVLAYLREGDEAPRSCGGTTTVPTDMVVLMRAQREPLELSKHVFSPVPLRATAEQLKRIEAERRAAAEELNEDDW